MSQTETIDISSTMQGLHVVVTGGTGALGRGVVARLLERGALCHVPSFAADELQSFPWRDDSRVHLYEGLDLAVERDVERLYDGLPGLWASIHCAGGFAMAPLAETRLEDLERLWRMNTVSSFLCCREAIRRMRRSGDGGRIVNVTARPALEPRQGAHMVAYAMSKAAVATLSQALGEEVASENILVNAVAPSIIDSPANRQAMPEADHDSWPTPEDIAESIVFLASPQNRTSRSALLPVYGKC